MSDTIGIIVGKFQVPYLAEHHKKIIEDTARKHRDVLILLLTPEITNTKRSPLGSTYRGDMLKRFWDTIPVADKGKFEWAVVGEYKDSELFFEAIDKKIAAWATHTRPNRTIVFGGNDKEMWKYYSGLSKLEDVGYYSETKSAAAIRNEYAWVEHQKTKDFGYGVIHTVNNLKGRDMIYGVGLVRDKARDILFVKYDNESKWTLPRVNLWESSKATLEETIRLGICQQFYGIHIKNPTYNKSYRSTDWRFRKIDEEPLYLVFNFDLDALPSSAHTKIRTYKFLNISIEELDNYEDEILPLVKDLKEYCEYTCPI
jgi:hypothetical protein